MPQVVNKKYIGASISLGSGRTILVTEKLSAEEIKAIQSSISDILVEKTEAPSKPITPHVTPKA